MGLSGFLFHRLYHLLATIQNINRAVMSFGVDNGLAGQTMRTVVVLGASYAGYTGAQTLATLLPKDWRVVVIERNTHANRELFKLFRSVGTVLVRR